MSNKMTLENSFQEGKLERICLLCNLTSLLNSNRNIKARVADVEKLKSGKLNDL